MKKLLIAITIIALSITACKGPGTQSYDIKYSVVQIGGENNTATSTGIRFTFRGSIDDINVTASDITLSGAASKGSATFTGSETKWTLSPITVNEAGSVKVVINKAGIETAQKTVAVHKQGEETPVDDISAAELVANIKLGWNLGNTLDASGLSWLGNNPTVTAMETAWVKEVTTKANIDTLKNAGFNGIRIPVSWAKAMDSNYNIRTDWMNRVKQIVDYAVSNEMYIILNTHHDEGIIKFLNSEMEESKKAFKKIWEQIADAFKDYDEKLIFEGLNEPRTPGSAAEWNGGTPEERNNINILEQIFVDAVRASGGNNVRRVLMISGYAASAGQTVLNAIILPNDPLNTINKFIVSIHAYEPYNFALNKESPVNTWSKNNSSDTSAITGPINRAYNTFVSKGIPVILGEFGAMNKNNEAVRAEWAKYYVEYAASRGIPCFWWDNCVFDGDGEKFGLLNRKTNNFAYPLVVSAMTGATIEPPVIDPPSVNPPNIGPTVATVTLGPNGEWGWQGFYELDSILNGSKITQGDTFTFTYSFISNVAIDRLQIFLVDNSSGAPNWWNQLSAYMPLDEDIPVNTVISGTTTLTATGTASSTMGAANKLSFSVSNGTASAPTLTFSAFTFVKTGN
jgi:endoglucanase